MEIVFIELQLIPHIFVLLQTLRANKNVFLIIVWILINFRSQMVEMIPIITLIASDHWTLICWVRLRTVTELSEEILIIYIHIILMIHFLVIELAFMRHPTIPAITLEVESLSKFKILVTLMTFNAASETEPMRFDLRNQVWILNVSIKLWIFELSAFHFSSECLNIACLACKQLLYYVPVLIPTLLR